jgi:hypothetical protein
LVTGIAVSSASQNKPGKQSSRRNSLPPSSELQAAPSGMVWTISDTQSVAGRSSLPSSAGTPVTLLKFSSKK